MLVISLARRTVIVTQAADTVVKNATATVMSGYSVLNSIVFTVMEKDGFLVASFNPFSLPCQKSTRTLPRGLFFLPIDSGIMLRNMI